jgi:predicted anti-sigma-YlaC factor YlaD
MADLTIQNQCIRGEEIGAYLDGELTADAEQVFEVHLGSCASCSSELRDQKGLLRTLDFAFGPERTIELPEGFSNIVALRAESDLSGFRSWSANGRALRVSAAVGLVALLLLGVGGSENGAATARSMLLAVLGLLDLISRSIYDLVLGLVVLVRALGRALVHSPSTFTLLAFVFFCGAAVVLVRQLARFHRRSTTRIGG